jgi:transposase-like protein
MIITDPIYQDADKAREHLESIRWPDGPVCPHCGSVDKASAIKANAKAEVRKGLYFCGACRQQFTVTVGTVYERSKIPLNKWVLATHLMAASKTAMSAHQMHRMLGITYKSAWFMCHRIREAMKSITPSHMGGKGEQIQADDTYIGLEALQKLQERVEAQSANRRVGRAQLQ